MKTKVVTVLDFSTGEVNIHYYEYSKEFNMEQFLTETLGYHLSSIHYMYTDSLKLNHNLEPYKVN